MKIIFTDNTFHVTKYNIPYLQKKAAFRQTFSGTGFPFFVMQSEGKGKTQKYEGRSV